VNKALKAHYDAVAALGCIVCANMNMGHTPAQIHHPWGRKGDNERKVIPLCYSHHQSGVNTVMYVSVHPHKKEWERRYGTEKELLAQFESLLDSRR
jgi:hypothetical protein